MDDLIQGWQNKWMNEWLEEWMEIHVDGCYSQTDILNSYPFCS